MTTAEKISDLLLKHLQGTLTSNEQQQLNEWLQQSDHNRHLFSQINNEDQLRDLLLSFQPGQMLQNEQTILEKIKARQQQARIQPINRRRSLQKWMAAAAILVSMATGAYLYLNNKKPAATNAAATVSDIAPGSEGAILTLADGRKVILDSLGNGAIASQPGANILLKDGQLSYQHLSSVTSSSVISKNASYNLLTTPKGRQFRVVLPDGTNAWLNAASSLRFPTAFTGKERTVEITGEIYFEVVKNSSQPFKVVTGNGTEVNVLGTSFNVNAYPEENTTKTTLLEGTVKVSAAQANILLTPGQQAQVAAGKQLSLLTHADLDKVMAWKNGLFNFDGVSLEEAMKQLEKWYDIEVEYEGKIPDIRFGGKLSRDLSLKGVLKSLEESELHFKIIEGRKLIVLP